MKTFYFSNEFGWNYAIYRGRFFPVTVNVAWLRDYYILGIAIMRNHRTILSFSC